MKLGFRTPSISKKIAAKTSVKRMVRNTTRVKAPKGMGIITDPKKAVSNKIYNKTTKGTGCLVSILILLVSFISILIACSNENLSSKDENLPQYKILFQVKLMSGSGKYGEILIQSYSKETPKEERENTLRKIIKKEGFVSAALYSTEDAYKANSSESFSKANPNALKNGYLGQITEKGEFIE